MTKKHHRLLKISSFLRLELKKNVFLFNSNRFEKGKLSGLKQLHLSKVNPLLALFYRDSRNELYQGFAGGLRLGTLIRGIRPLLLKYDKNVKIYINNSYINIKNQELLQ